jgi:hypothetical protein
MIGRDTLDRLVELGRRRGGLTSEDLRTALPVERMAAEDIALVVLELENAGIDVQVEDHLLARPGSPSPVPELPVIDLPGTAPPRGEALSPAPTPGLAQVAPGRPEPATRMASARRASWWFMIAAFALIVLLSLGLFSRFG